MRILGVGVDIVDNARIKKSLKNNLFIKRIFTLKEIANAKKKKIKYHIIQKDSQQKRLLLKQLVLDLSKI